MSFFYVLIGFCLSSFNCFSVFLSVFSVCRSLVNSLFLYSPLIMFVLLCFCFLCTSMLFILFMSSFYCFCIYVLLHSICYCFLSFRCLFAFFVVLFVSHFFVDCPCVRSVCMFPFVLYFSRHVFLFVVFMCAVLSVYSVFLYVF